MKKKYPITPTKKQLKILKEGWKSLQTEVDKFYRMVRIIEEDVELRSGIDGVEFFMCDNSYVGIGNVSRTMKLIQQEALEDNKVSRGI